MNKNNKLVLAIIPLLILPFLYGKKLSLFSSRKLWSTQESLGSRSPANFVDEEILTFKDYFQVESFNKFISYRTKTSFWSSSSSASKKYEKLIQSTMDKTFGSYGRGHPEVIENHLNKVTSDRLFNSIVENYLKSLDEIGVNKGKFIYNLSFIPEANQQISFEDEMTKAQTIQYNSKFKLSQYLLNDIKNVEDAVATIPTPINGRKFQYIGGNIHAYLDIENIGEEKKESSDKFSGQIVLRKYYRFNYPTEFNYAIQSENLKISSSAMVRAQKDAPIISTIDTIAKFDQDNDMIQPEVIYIHLGSIEKVKYKNKKFLARIFGSKKDKGVMTGELHLYGTYSFNNSDVEIEVSPKRLVYDINKKQFDPIGSDIQIDIKSSLLSPANKAKIIKDVLDVVLLRKPEYLIKELNIGRIHNQLNRLESQI